MTSSKCRICCRKGRLQAVRVRLERIKLGAAPLPGSHRVLDRRDIAQALAVAPDLRSSIEIPESVDVIRWSRQVTAGELIAPIAQSLRSNHFQGEEGLAERDLSLSRAIVVTEDNPKFEVTRIEPALRGEATRLRLWIPSEPRISPFWVTLDRDVTAPEAPAAGIRDVSVPPAQPVAQSHLSAMEAEAGCAETSAGCQTEKTPLAAPQPRLSAQPRRAILEQGRPICAPGMPNCNPGSGVRPTPSSLASVKSRGAETTAASANPILIKAGQPVQFVAQHGAMRIATSAISLDAGREGERVRVHNSLSGKVLIGTVIDPQTVQFDY